MSNAQPTVSVIMPAFNVGRFLDQALASVEAQTLNDIEIICVNDGSTDNTSAILSEHAARDGRIRIIDKPNGGYGSACNKGIEEAFGIWIAILEPDDWIEPTMLADMVRFAESLGEPIDIVKTPYWRIIDPDTPNERRLNCSYKGRIRPTKQPFTMASPHVEHLLIHHPSIWSALYRRDFLYEFGIRFREIPGAGWADNPFLVETLCQARAIAYLDRAYYCYREETSAKAKTFVQQNVETPIARWHDMMDVLERIGERNPQVLKAQFRRGFTYLDYIGEGIDLSDSRIHAIMESMFERMDDELVLGEPNIPPAWKMRYQKVKCIPYRKISPIPYAVSLVRAGLYSIVNVGPAESLSLISAVRRRDKAADNAAESITGDETQQTVSGLGGMLSIVIPVYNAEKYLDECLRSLEAQTYHDFEVVCVNDGSSDASLEIISKYAANDTRIRIVNQSNSGPSSARNAGIEAATGTYVCFLDADDLLETQACRRITEAASAEAPDVIAFGWSCFPKGRANRWLSARTRTRDAVYPWFDASILFNEMTNPYLRVAVKRDLLIEKGIRFDEEIGIGEDCAFLFSLFPRACTVKLISDKLYRYRMPHEGSIMSASVEGTPEKCLDDLFMAISIFGDWNRAGLLESDGRHLMHWFITMQLYTILRLPVPMRNEFVSLVKQLWFAHFTEEEVFELAVPSHDRRLIEIVASAREDGSLNVSERRLNATMLSWRLSEYGIGDLALTVFEHALHSDSPVA